MLYVALMRDEIRGVMDVLDGCTRERFVADRVLAGAASFHIVRLAERPLKASPAFRSAHPEIPWEELAAIRSRVEDGHFNEDPAAIWGIGSTEFPAIACALEALLPSDAVWEYRDEDEALLAMTAPPPVDPAAERLFFSRTGISPCGLDGVCRRYDVKCIRLFGSVLRDDFGPGSDVDMLVDLGPNAPTGWNVFRLDEELSELLGRKVDVMHGVPVRYIRDQILAEARTIYVADEAGEGEA